jgi:hypothetical protein
MDDDAEGLEPSEVPDLSLHCFRGHAGPVRARCARSSFPLLFTVLRTGSAGVRCCGWLKSSSVCDWWRRRQGVSVECACAPHVLGAWLTLSCAPLAAPKRRNTSRRACGSPRLGCCCGFQVGCFATRLVVVRFAQLSRPSLRVRSADGSLLATGSLDGKVHIWHVSCVCAVAPLRESYFTRRSALINLKSARALEKLGIAHPAIPSHACKTAPSYA